MGAQGLQGAAYSLNGKMLMEQALYIRMHAADNVAIVANDGGLPAGTVFPDGLTLVQHVPQGHKLSLIDMGAGEAVRRYNVIIGYVSRT